MKVGDVFSYKDNRISVVGLIISIKDDEFFFLEFESVNFTKIGNYFHKDSLMATKSRILASVDKP